MPTVAEDLRWRALSCLEFWPLPDLTVLGVLLPLHEACAAVVTDQPVGQGRSEVAGAGDGD